MRLVFHVLLLAFAISFSQTAPAELITNLLSHSTRIHVGNDGVDAFVTQEGPKSIATADFDSDGKNDVVVANADGSLNLFYGTGNGGFEPLIQLSSAASTLRGIVIADFDEDSHPDIVTADPFVGNLHIYLNNTGNRTPCSPVLLPSWKGARDMISGDFDGDGHADIAVAGYTIGLRFLKGDGSGSFTSIGDLQELAAPQPITPYDLSPVYTLRTFTPSSSTTPKIAVTHSDTKTLWILGSDSFGQLQIEVRLFTEKDPNFLKLHDFDIAPVTAPLSSSVPDLLTVSRNSNTVTLWRGSPNPPYFFTTPYQSFRIPGGPRSVKVSDIDNDGWGDVAVVVRNFDQIRMFGNNTGLLEPLSVLPTGRSPRELIMADLNGDSRADIVNVNRVSQDMGTHLTDANSPDKFKTPARFYSVEGEPAALEIADINGDGFGDVLQLHRSAGDVSIRFANPDGSLADPVYYFMGANPTSMQVADLNGDGAPDVSVATLNGTISVRRKLPAGNELGALTFVGGIEAPVLTHTHADIDGDGNPDLIASYLDGRVAIFHAQPDFSFLKSHTLPFTYQARVIVTTNADVDGNRAIVGLGAAGDGVVLNSITGFAPGSTPQRADFNFGSGRSENTRDALIAAGNVPFLLLATDSGVKRLDQTPGINYQAGGSLGSDTPVSSIASGDFDGDSVRDYAVGYDETATVKIYSMSGTGVLSSVLETDVPSVKFIASGDIDGDGMPDLAGSGAVLWTALSGSQPAPAPLQTSDRQTKQGFLINEILPKNDSFGIPENGGKKSDAIEVFNDTASAINIFGWTVRLLTTLGETRDFIVPVSTLVPSQERFVIVCQDGISATSSAVNTGYNLPSEGGQITLLDTDDMIVDTISYPPLGGDISYARYKDGSPSFILNSYPDIGLPNIDNGSVSSGINFLQMVPADPDGDEPIQIHVQADNNSSIATITVHWSRLDTADKEKGWIYLYDDGLHDDGQMHDRHFTGFLESGFPDGAEVEFFIRGIDLSDQTTTIPDITLFTKPGNPLRNFSVAIGSAASMGTGLQISEIVASNDGLIIDEAGENEDWIEIRNTSETAIELGGMALAQSTTATPDQMYFFPPEMILAPGQYIIVWADNQTSQGPMHAPFKLSKSGESLNLIGTTANGVTAVTDSITWPPLATGQAYTVIGIPGDAIARVQAPTPLAQNLISGTIELVQPSIPNTLRFAYPTGNAAWALESSSSLSATSWQTIHSSTQSGIERIHTTPVLTGQNQFFRVRISATTN
jgi:hypothetical protein